MRPKKAENITLEEENIIITLLHKGKAIQIRKMIEDGQLPFNLTFRKLNGRGVLHEIVYHVNNNDLLHWLLENKFEELDLNALDYGGSTALIFAAKHRNHKAAELLLAYGADPDIQNCAQRKFINVVKSEDVSWEDAAERLVLQAKEGTLLKPALMESNTALKQRRRLDKKYDNSVSRHDITPGKQPANASCFSLCTFIKQKLFPFFTQRYEELSSETYPLTQEELLSGTNKFKKQ